MTPAGVAGGKPLMEISGFGVNLRLTRPADNNVAEQRHPSPGMEHLMRPAPADGRVDPVPRRCGDQDIEAPSAVVPLLERRILDPGVGESGEPLASDRGHARAGLDGGHRAPKRCQRACRLTGTAAHLKHRRPSVHAGDRDQIGEQLVRVGRPHAVVELGHLVEHPAEVTTIRSCHRTIVPSAAPETPVSGVVKLAWLAGTCPGPAGRARLPWRVPQPTSTAARRRADRLRRIQPWNARCDSTGGAR